MIRILSLVTLAGLFAGPVRGQEPQTYTIKLKKSAEGKSYRVELLDDGTQGLQVEELKGDGVQKKDEKVGRHYVYRQTVLKLDPGTDKATRLKQQYEKAREVEKGELVTLPYEGKTVLIEKKGNKYLFRIEGGEEITGADARFLNKHFNRDTPEGLTVEEAVLPRKAVRVNEPWQIDLAELAKALRRQGGLEMDTDPKTTQITGKLTRVYKKDGRQFGVMVYHLKFRVKSMGKGGEQVKAEPNSHVDVKVKLDACIDGSARIRNETTDAVFRISFLGPDPAEPQRRVIFSLRLKESKKIAEQ
jgi:hypothetical protein